ncbi:hypothetical protein CRYUN_Cryun36dG0057000 [Craigia yunnanensis]
MDENRKGKKKLSGNTKSLLVVASVIYDALKAFPVHKAPLFRGLGQNVQFILQEDDFLLRYKNSFYIHATGSSKLEVSLTMICELWVLMFWDWEYQLMGMRVSNKNLNSVYHMMAINLPPGEVCDDSMSKQRLGRVIEISLVIILLMIEELKMIPIMPPLEQRKYALPSQLNFGCCQRQLKC